MNAVIYDKKPKSPSENLRINEHCANLVREKHFDSIARTYLHKKGVILAKNQSDFDLYKNECERENYEISKRPSGGSAIVVDPTSTLCYSFFQSGSLGYSPSKIYEKITFPLAENLGKEFSIEGTYYLRLPSDSGAVPVAGHAIASQNNAIQFDGVVNLTKLDSYKISKLLKMRKLYKTENEKFIEMDGITYALKGTPKEYIVEEAELLRDEYREIEQLIGIDSLGLGRTEFESAFLNSIESVFGQFKEIDRSELGILPAKKNENISRGKSCLGHCFIDFLEPEPAFNQ